MGLFQKKEAAQLPPPRHIAIIMDGNGRWARKRGLPRTAGHAAGAESFRRIANYCRTLGVRYLTVYALSRLSPELQELCRNAEARSREYHEVQVNFCLNYGGRDEILRAARRFAQAVANGEQEPDQLDESLFSRYLYSAGVPDPELIIRPSGEKRTSNFLLWQSAYSEYVFQDVLWPDYSPRDLDAAIAEFHRRNRRFGGA